MTVELSRFSGEPGTGGESFEVIRNATFRSKTNPYGYQFRF
jgi:hypothetical protein